MFIIAKYIYIYINHKEQPSCFLYFSCSQPAFLARRREGADVEATSLGGISKSIPQSLPFKAQKI